MAGRERNLRRKAVSEEPEEEDAAGNPDGAAATINKWGGDGQQQWLM